MKQGGKEIPYQGFEKKILILFLTINKRNLTFTLQKKE